MENRAIIKIIHIGLGKHDYKVRIPKLGYFASHFHNMAIAR